MTIEKSPQPSTDISNPSDLPLSCTNCGGAEDLVLESIGSAMYPGSGNIIVEYSCTTCASSFSQATSPRSVAHLLGKSPSTSPVLQIGGRYIHCCEPMEEGEIQLLALQRIQGDLVEAPAILIETTVLRCRCGFQLSIPTS